MQKIGEYWRYWSQHALSIYIIVYTCIGYVHCVLRSRISVKYDQSKNLEKIRKLTNINISLIPLQIPLLISKFLLKKISRCYLDFSQVFRQAFRQVATFTDR